MKDPMILFTRIFNFSSAQHRIKYYNSCLFHTVHKYFTAQTGDPSGKGTGGDSIYKFLYGEQARFFGDEIHPDLKHSKKGTVSMASAGENLNASQFYFTLRDNLDYLDGKHTVFGEVAEGFDTLTRINEAFVDESSRPFKNIRVKHTYILDDPFDDPPQLAELIPQASPEGKPPDEIDDVRLEDDWVPLDETMDPEQLEESMREKEAHSHAVVLEMIGDIPDAEIKPPENVLFVCKLNPVTQLKLNTYLFTIEYGKLQDEDLEIIFSRFGKVTSADIIRDYKTGDSLCYAFIEFETQEACEAAYFKMDNVLIDDRRIHVDFSQSVSKLWRQYRRGGKRSEGKGCFKCGAIDHFAKDCTEGSGSTPAPQKYVLKDSNTQRGNQTKSYEMIFDDDALESEKPHEARQSEQKAKGSSDRRKEDRASDHIEDRMDRPVTGRRHNKDDVGSRESRDASNRGSDRGTSHAAKADGSQRVGESSRYSTEKHSDREQKRLADYHHDRTGDGRDGRNGREERRYRNHEDHARSHGRYHDHDEDRARDSEGHKEGREKDDERKRSRESKRGLDRRDENDDRSRRRENRDHNHGQYYDRGQDGRREKNYDRHSDRRQHSDQGHGEKRKRDD
ncbi:peptidyl-prolyl cis-trans isomerase CYP59-like isoform X2 [Nymphaea colorata]|uniref:peptidyl-prolyl cis-trans isomerase CYP59-like isoform X2 n=1 Tax=Nymphaea colorata TaxID=210225 RepID=UPI00214E8395|nr:peptidyl-prolyl cis-trans isomerase CYP59-like isoform X2 [Nymphaea colorata]